MKTGSCTGQVLSSFCLKLFSGLVAVLILCPVAVMGNPSGGQVVGGSAGITTAPGTVTIHQASPTAIINWQTFSINSGELTQFIQPASTSAVLNRVLGGQMSMINGRLSANGQVYLINGNGIVIGAGGIVNTAGFTASTRDISDADFLAGHLHFTGSNNAGVQNLGKITALGGDVVLIGKTVDNQGTIHAPRGTAGLVAADDVLLAQKNTDGSTILVRPSETATSAAGRIGVHNSGDITAAAAELKAANGNIYALAIQNEGALRATMGMKQGGRVWLTSDSGAIVNAGTINASANAAGGKGGTITLKSANGTVSHSGQISAQGGPGGAGGNAEISGSHVQLTGTVELTAMGGSTGTLLVDPATLTIATTGGDITPAAVVSALRSANVTYSAPTSITVTDAINASGNADSNTLTLDAPTVNLNQAITLGATESLAGTATTVNVGASGLVQNGIDVAGMASAATINLANTTYTLTGSELLINKSLTLVGNGAVIDANHASRVMEIDGSVGGVTVNLDGVTLENGNGKQGGRAGAAGTALDNHGGGLLIFSESGRNSNVTLDGSTVSANQVDATTDLGGGIYNDGQNSGNAILAISHGSTIAGNAAVFKTGYTQDLGGGIYNNAENSGVASVTITGSTLSGNTADTTVDGLPGAGGAIYNDGENMGVATMTIDSSMLTGNTSDSGGAIYNDGGLSGDAILIIRNASTLSGNHSNQNGGGIFDDGSSGIAALTITNSTLTGNSAAYDGGGIYGGSTLVTLTGSTLSNNTAAHAGGGFYHGAGSNGAASDLMFTNCMITGNTAGVFGGGICNDGGGLDGYGPGGSLATCEISGGTLSGNSALEGGAIINYSITAGSKITITGSTLSGNGGGSDADGGAIYNRGLGTLAIINSMFSGDSATIGGAILQAGGAGTTTITGSTFSGNSATNGGAIYNNAGPVNNVTLSITSSTFSGNSATTGGGAMYMAGVGTTMVAGSAISGNMAADGGGFYDGAGAVTEINSSTLTGNTASVSGGAIDVTSAAGVATVQLVGDTVVGNTVTTGSGGGISGSATTGPVRVKVDGTILSGNTEAGVESDLSISGTAALDSRGYNIYGQNGAAGGFTGTGTDILLADGIDSILQTSAGAPVLENNGGPTKTIALIPGSIALNAGNPADLGTTDQRGIVRGSPLAFTGTAPDIGAYEAQFISIHADDQTITYGTASPTPTYTITNGPVNAASFVSGSVAYITPEINAGTYTGDIGPGTVAVSGPTYFLDFSAGTLVINPASLTVTALNDVKTYDGLPYSGGAGISYRGFMYGENESVVSGTLAYGGTAQGAIDSGLYTIG